MTNFYPNNMTGNEQYREWRKDALCNSKDALVTFCLDFYNWDGCPKTCNLFRGYHSNEKEENKKK